MITPFEVIRKKRDGEELSPEEISAFVRGVTEGSVELYQLSAWLMAVRLKGMTEQETVALTKAMIESGDEIDLSVIPGVKVDKHSTGGVGDTTTLILAPLVAAAGAKLAKMSGRGLGHTGGTLDKLESIPGLRVDLSQREFLEQVEKVGVAVVSPTAKLVPADKVMSKKLAAGAQVVLLDVKFGRGAFMTTLSDAKELAQLMVSIGRNMGRKVAAAISAMDEPLGSHIGNALEVKEAIEILKGERITSPLAQVALELARRLLVLGGVYEESESSQAVRSVLESGRGLEKFTRWIEAQGGDPRVVDDLSLLPQAPVKLMWRAPRSGVVTRLQADLVGRAAMILGAGRQRKEDPIDPAVGIILKVRVGEEVEKGQPLAEIYCRYESQAAGAIALLDSALDIEQEVEGLEQVLIRDWIF